MHTSDVRLKHSIGWADLPANSVGVVQSVWFAPTAAYEVEFQRTEAEGPVRVLVRSDEIELEAETEPVLAIA